MRQSSLNDSKRRKQVFGQAGAGGTGDDDALQPGRAGVTDALSINSRVVE